MASPTRVSPKEGYALWADTCDSTLSPISALSDRLVRPWIERCVGTSADAADTSVCATTLDGGADFQSAAPRLISALSRRIIDVGAGTGRWTARLAALGFDASPDMLAVAAGKPGVRGRLAVGDAMVLPIATASADLVLCTLMLAYARNPLTAWRELTRILKPGGSLILTDFHPDAAAYGWRRTFRSHGQIYEIENHPYSLNQLAAEGLMLREYRHAKFEEPERDLFDRAGKSALFETARHTPAVLAAWWTRI